MTRYSSTMTEALQEVREGFSPKQIKMAIGIAADKRYARGNYTGAVNAIEKIKKGLSDHPQVAAVLKRLNTDFDPELEEEVELDETADPKIVKAVDKLKKGDTVEIEYDSSIKKGHKGKFKVTAKNTVNKGRTVKTTLQNLANPSGVKHYIYQYKDRDGAYFAIGDMGASMRSLKAGYGEELEEKLGKNADAGDYIDDFKKSDAPQFKGKSDKKKKDMAIAAYLDAKDKKEEVELDEGMPYKFAAVDKKGLVIGFASKESDAKDMARRNKGRVVTLTKPLPDNKKSGMMINRPLPDGMDKFPTNTSATQGKRMEEVEKKMDKPDSAKMVDQGREDKKKTRIAQLQLQIAKAQETINKLNAQEKPNG